MKESDVQEQIASAMQEEIQANYDRIRQIVEDEITRIKNDPALYHLIKDEEE